MQRHGTLDNLPSPSLTGQVTHSTRNCAFGYAGIIGKSWKKCRLQTAS
jgi:hypothetical protein